MTDNFRWPGGLIAAALIFAVVLPALGAPVHAEGTTLYLPWIAKPPTGPAVQVTGRVQLQGRTVHSGAILEVNGAAVARTDAAGNYRFSVYLANPATHTFTVTARCPAYLWAETVQTVAGSTSLSLPDVCLLAGDVQGPISTTVTPPAGCESTEPVPVNGPPDGIIDIYDLSFVSLHKGYSQGSDHWGPNPCHPGAPYLAYRADVNGDGQVDNTDEALVAGNIGLFAPQPWVACPPAGASILPPNTGPGKAQMPQS